MPIVHGSQMRNSILKKVFKHTPGAHPQNNPPTIIQDSTGVFLVGRLVFARCVTKGVFGQLLPKLVPFYPEVLVYLTLWIQKCLSVASQAKHKQREEVFPMSICINFGQLNV